MRVTIDQNEYRGILLRALPCGYIRSPCFPIEPRAEELMETVELRPLSLGELLDRTFSLYRRHFWLFVGIMAIPCSFAIPFNLFFLAKQGSAVTPSVGTFPSP